jgi:hypothetical protein
MARVNTNTLEGIATASNRAPAATARVNTNTLEASLLLQTEHLQPHLL